MAWIPIAAAAASALLSNRDSGGGGVSYSSSPQQTELWNINRPLAQASANFGLGNIQYSGSPATYIPQQPVSYAQSPQALNNSAMINDPVWGNVLSGILSGVQSQTGGSLGLQFPNQTSMGMQPGTGNIESLWPIPSYGLPNPEMLMPTAQTLNSISPAVMSGILQPYQLAQSQLMETLGGGGQLGSAMGGFSGSGAGALGKFWGQAAPTIGMQAWNMIQPALQQSYADQLQREQALWGEQLQQFKYPWQAGPSMLSMSLPNPVVQQPGQSSLAGLSSLLSGFGNLLGSSGSAGSAAASAPSYSSWGGWGL